MSQNLLNNLTVKQLKRAIAIKARLSRLESELSILLAVNTGAKAPARKRRRKMSAAGRARIAAAAKARWAKTRAKKATVAP